MNKLLKQTIFLLISLGIFSIGTNLSFASDIPTINLSAGKIEETNEYQSYYPFYSKDDKYIYSIGNDMLTIDKLDVSTKKKETVLDISKGGEGSIVYSQLVVKNGKEYVLCVRNGFKDIILQELFGAYKETKISLKARTGDIMINGLTSTEDGKYIIASLNNQKAILLDTISGKEVVLPFQSDSIRIASKSNSIYFLEGTGTKRKLNKFDIKTKNIKLIDTIEANQFILSGNERFVIYNRTVVDSLYSGEDFRLKIRDINKGVDYYITNPEINANGALSTAEEFPSLSHNGKNIIFERTLGFGDSANTALNLLTLPEEWIDISKSIAVGFDKPTYQKGDKAVVSLKGLNYDISTGFVYIEIPKEITVTKIYGKGVKVLKDGKWYIKYKLEDIIKK